MDADLEESNVGLGEEGGDERKVEGEEGEEVGDQPAGQHHVHRTHTRHQYQQARLAVPITLKSVNYKRRRKVS